MLFALIALSSPADAAPVPVSRFTLSYGAWGYREGVGTRLNLTPAASLTTSLDLFRSRIGFVSNTGLELHPVSADLGKAGWIEPTLGLGGYATGGITLLHGDVQPTAGLYAAPGIRWSGPRGRSATMLGATGRYQLQGTDGLDPVALTFAVEYRFGKRSPPGRIPLPSPDVMLPEAL